MKNISNPDSLKEERSEKLLPSSEYMIDDDGLITRKSMMSKEKLGGNSFN